MEISFVTTDESAELLSFADATSLDELALANEKSTMVKDTNSASGKRCFFMVIGIFSRFALQISVEKTAWKKNGGNTKKTLGNSAEKQAHGLFHQIVIYQNPSHLNGAKK
jgi:hypothetical protein